MIITRKSPFSGKIHKMDLPIDNSQIEKYNKGALIQNAFPNLTPGQREFYKTGITEEEWDKLFN